MSVVFTDVLRSKSALDSYEIDGTVCDPRTDARIRGYFPPYTVTSFASICFGVGFGENSCLRSEFKL